MKELEFEEFDAYVKKLHLSEYYTRLGEEDKQKIFFTAYELLKDTYNKRLLTPRIVSLQVLYMLEGEEEEYAKMRRQGLEQLGAKGVTASLSRTDDVAPSVIKILRASNGITGRLI